MATTTTAPPDHRPPRTATAAPKPLRVTPARRHRNLPLLAVGVVLMLGFGVVSAWLQINAGDRDLVLAVERPVAAGAVIGDGDVRAVRISADPALQPVPAAERRAVVGQTAAVQLVPGSLLTRLQLGAASGADAGKVVLGLSLKPGQAPDGLRPGTRVTVVATGPAATLAATTSPAGATSTGASASAAQDPRGAILVREATVSSVSEERNSDNVTVSVMLSEAEAPAVAGAAAAGQVTLASRSAR